MKATERHHLKENDFAVRTAAVADRVRENRGRITMVAGILVALAVIVGGYMLWRNSQANRAGAALGIAMATAQGQVVPAPTLPGATQAAGTFPTEKARAEAAIKAYQDVITQYPGSNAALAAQYYAASELLGLGRAAEAEQGFAAVVASDPNGFQGSLAKLGHAQAQLAAGKSSDAIATLTALSAARDGALPSDGVLMELGRASLKAGKTDEARAAFKRVVDEFPESTYVADARQRLAAMN